MLYAGLDLQPDVRGGSYRTQDLVVMVRCEPMG